MGRQQAPNSTPPVITKDKSIEPWQICVITPVGIWKLYPRTSTEIHSGLYRGTILIELDRVGQGDGFKQKEGLKPEEKAIRVKNLLVAIKNLWVFGRQSRFLSDISPKFVIAAMLTTKNPIFLESVQVDEKDRKKLNSAMLKETLKDYQKEILKSVIGVRQGFFNDIPENVKPVGEAFDQMATWIDEYYK
jgi:CRISPR-associated protein Cst2